MRDATVALVLAFTLRAKGKYQGGLEAEDVEAPQDSR